MRGVYRAIKLNAFLTVCWSSEKQVKGTSLERQLAKTQEFRTKNIFELIELVNSTIRWMQIYTPF